MITIKVKKRLCVWGLIISTVAALLLALNYLEMVKLAKFSKSVLFWSYIVGASLFFRFWKSISSI